MAQPFLMRYPLIIGQGALGTQESNDMVASSRYTEAKPSEIADLMMKDFKKNTVPLKRTYNDEFDEPVVLPSLFPNALVNGKQTIAIGLAHSSQPANLKEVCDGIIAYLRDNNITLDGLMEYIKGPDYPLGNVVINSNDIKEAFRTGKSVRGLKVRGDYYIDKNKIIFTSIPYRTYRNKIKEQITDNIDEFDKLLEDFSDESNLGQNKLIFTVKPTANMKYTLEKIFELTDLQTSISYNMNYIVNGTPKLCSLKDLIIAYSNHQDNVLIKSTEYDKEKAEARAHILRGLLAAIDKIDEVIELIKGSNSKDDAKTKLQKFLNIDEIQAGAILDMKLSKLTRIDKQELVDELKEKEDIIAECIKILTNKEYRTSILIKKIEEMKNKYGDERRTKLLNIEITKEEKEIAHVEPEKCVVILNEDGGIKRIPATSFRVQKRNGKGVKTLNDITSAVIRTNTIDSLMVFTDRGRMYRILVDDIPVGTNISKATPITSLIEMEPGEKSTLIYSIYRDTDAKYVLFVTKNGLVKKTPLTEYTGTKKKSGINAINIKDGDALAAVCLASDENVILLSHEGRAINFSIKDITPTGRVAAGVKGISLNDGDYVVSALPIRDKNDELGLFTENGLGLKIKLTDIMSQTRGGKGLITYKPTTSSGKIVGGTLLANDDAILIIGNTNSICINASDMPTLSRGAIGNIILKCKIEKVSKV